jgi:hypothetical protein
MQHRILRLASGKMVVDLSNYTMPTFAGIPARPFYTRNAVTRYASNNGGAKPSIFQTLFGR